MIGSAPDESPISALLENSHIMGIRFGAMSPWSQPIFMNLLCMGEFMLPYLDNATCYGHETCTTGYNKDGGL